MSAARNELPSRSGTISTKRLLYARCKSNVSRGFSLSTNSAKSISHNVSDYRLVPWLALLYLLSFLDRTNIGNANLFGLSANLGLSDSQYSACLAVFFAFYVLFEVPSNMVLKAWR